MIKKRITISCEAFRSDFTAWSDNTYTERIVFYIGDDKIECVREEQYESLKAWKEAIKETAKITVQYID